MCLFSKCSALPASDKPVKAMFHRGHNRWPAHSESVLSIWNDQIRIPLLDVSHGLRVYLEMQ